MNQLFDNEVSAFPTAYSEILYRMKRVEPIKYGKTRNFINGAVTYLSPYISRGVISTAQVFEWVKEETPYSLSSIEKFIQELAWRDYWQQVWRAKGDPGSVRALAMTPDNSRLAVLVRLRGRKGYKLTLFAGRRIESFPFTVLSHYVNGKLLYKEFSIDVAFKGEPPY